jgi:Type II secretion system (T2SS), protein M subtype b
MTIQSWNNTQWLRRAIFVLGNLAAALVLYLGVILPIQGFFSVRQSHISEQRALLTRLRSIAEQASQVQAASLQIAEQAKRGEFVAGSNEGVINADLQTRLKAKAEQSGARLRSVQALPFRTQEGVRYAGSRLEVFGPLQSIHRTLYAIEHGTPYHFITDAQIRPSVPGNRTGTSVEPTIEARLEVFVAVQPDGRKP